MILYLLTISCQQKSKLVEQRNLDEVILWLKLNIPSLKIYNHSYERSGKHTQLHFHGIVMTKSRFRYKPFIQYGDVEHMHLTYRIQWSRITNYQGAIDYIYKDTQNNLILQDQIITENYYKYSFFNMDTQMFIEVKN